MKNATELLSEEESHLEKLLLFPVENELFLRGGCKACEVSAVVVPRHLPPQDGFPLKSNWGGG